MTKIQQQLLREQKIVTREENRLAFELQTILAGLESDLIKVLAIHDPSQYTQNAARARHLTSLIEETDALIASAYKSVEKSTHKQLVLTAARTGQETGRVLAVSLNVRTLKLSPDYTIALAKDVLVSGGLQEEWWLSQSEQVRQRFTRAIREGLSHGETIPKLMQRVLGTKENNFRDGILNVPKHQAEALARTSVQTVSQGSRLAMYKKHRDVIAGVILSVTMDSRVTKQCEERDGKEYTLDGEPVGHNIPFDGGPPYHYNCRTQLMPKTKDL